MRYSDLIEGRAKRFYIRFGAIPQDERSEIFASPNYLSRRFTPGDKEKGVSVFDAEWSAERQRWLIVDVGNFATLMALLQQQRPAYLVTGRRAGYGMDEETLLRQVKIIETLPYEKMFVLAFGEDGACEDYLPTPDDD